MAELDYGLLGPLQVRRDGAPLALGAAKQRALLALLLLHANRVVSTDLLVEALWPKKAPGKPQTAVQGYVSQLRKLLEPERKAGEPFRVLVTEAAGYALKIDPQQLDLGRFERLLAQGKEALAAGSVRQAESLLQEALALFRGPPLADFTYEPWAQNEIGRIEELRLTSVEERIEAELALARHSELTAELETLVSEQPLRERLRGQLMLALYRSGRQADALEAYQQARATLVEQLGIDPSPELQTLYKKILNQDETLHVEPLPIKPPTNLPAPPNALVGRIRELSEVSALLGRDDVRLVTLTGVGGTGKTRLAHRVASDLLEWYEGGVFFVSLSAIRDPALTLPTVAQTLGVREQPNEPLVETIAAYLGGKPILLVLDNFEQISDAAPNVASLLSAAAKVKVLVTSRARLRISGEHVYPVPPLTLPQLDASPSEREIRESEAVRLFVERAQAADADFALGAADAATVAEICARLDGLPLALELAAARVRVLPPRAMLTRLTERLDLLTGGGRDLDERQRSLRATIEWSYSLLTPDERTLLARLSVFVGGCRLDAAQAVYDPDGESAAMIDALAGLVDKSLLRQRPDTDQEPRFSMLETIKEYASAQLEALEDRDEVRRRHFEYYSELAQDVFDHLGGSDEHLWLDRIARDQDNFRAALASMSVSTSEERLRLARNLVWFWNVRGHAPEGAAALERSLADASPEPSELRATALDRLATLAGTTGDHARAEDAAKASLEMFRFLGNDHGAAYAVDSLAWKAFNTRNFVAAESLAKDALQLLRGVGDPFAEHGVLMLLGLLALYRNDRAYARDVFRTALDYYERAGERLHVQRSRAGLALTALQEDDLRQAADLNRRALAEADALKAVEDVYDNLVLAAAIAAKRGCYRRAVRLLGAADALSRSIRLGQTPVNADLSAQTLKAAREHLNTDDFHLCFDSGSALTLEEAVAYARQEDVTPTVTPERNVG